MYQAKITRNKLIELYRGLQGVSGLTGVVFAYAIAKNIEKLDKEIKAIDKASKPDEDFIEFEKERSEIAKSYAKTENGKHKTINVNGNMEYDIENEVEFDKKLKKFEAENKDIIDKRKKQVKEFNEFIDEEVEVELYQINPSNLPENITAGQLSKIACIVMDKEPSK